MKSIAVGQNGAWTGAGLALLDRGRSIGAWKVGPGPSIGIRLALLGLLAFLPVIGCGWVMWDDDVNFLNNPNFRGLTREHLAWAWRTDLLGVYQPLSWTLLEAEYAAWGMNPRGYHGVGLLLHAANAAALYALAVALMRRAMPSRASGHPDDLHLAAGIATALWAVHPLRAEAVAWISCQPYLPSTLCCLLSLLAYLRCHDEGLGRAGRIGWGAVAWCLYVAASLFKGIAVTLPAILLLLDAYPLGRFKPGPGLVRRAFRVGLEKLPYALAAGVLAVEGMRIRGIMPAPFAVRLATAAQSVWFYPTKTLVPWNLTILYPPPAEVLWTRPYYLGCLLGVVGVTVLGFALRRRYPALLAAWLGYLAVLAPNSGLVQRNWATDANDRYSYAAMMPLYVALSGGLFLALGRWGDPMRSRRALAGFGAFLLIMVGLSWDQSASWVSTVTLHSRALERACDRSAVIEHNLGIGLLNDGDNEGARSHLERSLALDDGFPQTYVSLGNLEARDRHFDRAIARYEQALAMKPDFAVAHRNLGQALAASGDLDGALARLLIARELAPGDPQVRVFLGRVHYRSGRIEQALAAWDDALGIDPENAMAREDLARIRPEK
ncbi:MAG: tetratricopeptide repeat protein [Isosphaeraceae bacterium]